MLDSFWRWLHSQYPGPTGNVRIPSIGLVAAIAASVAQAGDAGAPARYEPGPIATTQAAIAAVKPWLPRDADQLELARVTLVKEADDLAAIDPEIGGVGGRKGFPGPVWVVVVRARYDCARGSQKLAYVYEATTGRELLRSGFACVPLLHRPAGRGRSVPVERDQHAVLERRLVRSEFTLCRGGCRDYRRTHADCERTRAKLNGRALYRCRIQREEVGGRRQSVPAETVCAALGRIGDKAYDARPLAECR